MSKIHQVFSTAADMSGNDLSKKAPPAPLDLEDISSTAPSSLATTPEGGEFVATIMRNRAPKQPATSSDDIAGEYDTYYTRLDETDPHSALYNKRFGDDRVLVRERELIEDAVSSLLERINFPSGEPKRLRIMDFGAGDGRLFPVFKELAERLKAQNIHMELVAVEPSQEGIKNFQSDLAHLYEFNYITPNELHSLIHDEKQEKGYVAGTMAKDNLSVTFIHSHVDDSMSHTASLIGEKIHLSLAMFGVLAHVPTRKKRHEYVEMFHEKTVDDGETLITVPTPKRFIEERDAYAMMIKHGTPVGQAREHRDFYYCKFKEETAQSEVEVRNFYHDFTSKELTKLVTLLKSSSLKQSDEKPGPGFVLVDNTIHAVSKKHAADLTRNSALNSDDAKKARLLTNRFGKADHLAKGGRDNPELRIESYCDYIAARGIKPGRTR